MTVSFYEVILGLTETARTRSPGGSKIVFLKAPESDVQIEICEFNASGPVNVGTNITHLAFEVDDLEAFSRYATAKGYPLSDGPMPTGDRQLMAFIDAPEGYEIELIQRAKCIRDRLKVGGRVWSTGRQIG